MIARSVAEFVRARYAVPLHMLRVSIRPIGGGLESEVTRARLRTSDQTVPKRMVVKTLRGRSRRAATVYELLRTNPHAPPMPTMVGVHAGHERSTSGCSSPLQPRSAGL
jgi:hypothetical protein